jgi:hypothetical protein
MNSSADIRSISDCWRSRREKRDHGEQRGRGDRGADVIAILVVLATLLSYAIGWLIGVPILVPFLNAAASFPFMVAALTRGDVRLAVARMLLWAMTMGVSATVLSYARPAQTDTLFLRGEAFRTEMFAWVMTGRGAESSPSQFLPQHARDTVVFAALAIATGGALAMPMGAALMNYMGHYAGTLAAAGRYPALTIALAWHPWAVIRVISFVILGVPLSAPLLSRLFRFRVDWAAVRPLLIGACAGLFADVVLKTLFAPTWQRLLLRVIGW